MSKPDYDTTVARIAGNIASGLALRLITDGRTIEEDIVAVDCVSLARAIVTEVKRTQPFPYSADVQLMAAIPSQPVESETP